MASAKIVGSFQINTAGNRTTDEVIVAGNYADQPPLVNGKNFPMRPMPEGPRKIVFLEFDHGPTSEEVLAAAASQGLERPRYEDALFFGEQHPEEQRKTPIVFLHEPWPDPHDNLYVLVLDCYDGSRDLLLSHFGILLWIQQCRFAFVRNK